MISEKIYDCAVIGAGASGLFFAARLPQKSDVCVIEKNHITGKKLLITGKGRCNVTNNSDIQTFIKNVRTNPEFMYGAFSNFSSYDTIEFFEKLGVGLKTERGNRVFPQSDKSSDIVDALTRKMLRNGVALIRDKISCVKKENDIFFLSSDRNTYLARKLVIATGGKSYPSTGSTGDGYAFAKAFGHTITEIKPSLVPIEIDDLACGNLQGLSLKNVTIKIVRDKKQVFEDFGEMIFTHFGMSGPIILSASAFVSPGDSIFVDLKPALDEKQLDKRVLSDFSKYINRNLSNALRDLLPLRLIPFIIERSGISPYKKVNGISFEERKKLLTLMKKLEFKVKGVRPISEAIITSGGVCVKEINPKTMESKLVKGLYFIGEMIDVDAYTGGFNLQIAFSTAAAAVKNIFIDKADFQ